MWALLPIKKYSDAKGRLSGQLSGPERAEFSKAMAEDVIATLKGDGRIERIFICSADPEAQETARLMGCEVLPDTAPGGLNKSVAAAAAALKKQGCKSLMIVHADLPCLSAADLGIFLAACSQQMVTITPDRHGDGSNLLAWDLSLPFHVGYGPGSFERHCDQARRLQAGPHICPLETAAFDIDTAEDFALLQTTMARRCGPRTKALLRGRQHAAA